MKKMCLLSISILLAAIAPITAYSADTLKIKLVVGDVDILKKITSRWEKARTGGEVMRDDIIRTGVNSLATLHGSKADITVAERTIIKVSALIDSQKSNGKNFDIVQKLSRKFQRESGIYDYSTTAAGVRGDTVERKPAIEWSDGVDEPASTAENNVISKARRLYSSGKYDSAISLLNRNLKSLPTATREEALFLLGNAYFSAGDFNSSVSCLKKVLDGKHSDTAKKAASLYQISLAYNFMGREREGIGSLERFIKEYSDSPYRPEVHLLLARWYRESGDSDKSEKNYQAIINNYPNSDIFGDAESELSSLKK